MAWQSRTLKSAWSLLSMLSPAPLSLSSDSPCWSKQSSLWEFGAIYVARRVVESMTPDFSTPAMKVRLIGDAYFSCCAPPRIECLSVCGDCLPWDRTLSRRESGGFGQGLGFELLFASFLHRKSTPAPRSVQYLEGEERSERAKKRAKDGAVEDAINDTVDVMRFLLCSKVNVHAEILHPLDPPSAMWLSQYWSPGSIWARQKGLHWYVPVRWHAQDAAEQ